LASPLAAPAFGANRTRCPTGSATPGRSASSTGPISTALGTQLSSPNVIALVVRAGTLWLALSALLTLACVAPLASASRALERGLGVDPVRLQDVSAGVLLVAFVALWIVFAAVLLAVVGGRWLLISGARAAAEEDEAEEQAKFTVLMIALLIGAAGIVPLSWAVFISATVGESTVLSDGRHRIQTPAHVRAGISALT
jgi:hypothetical protein